MVRQNDGHRHSEPLMLERNPEKRAALMQQRSVFDPGSAFPQHEVGTGLSDPCCRLVGLASFNDIAIM